MSLPDAAVFIASHNKQLTGTIPAALCSGCDTFDVGSNGAITGPVPAWRLPTLDVSWNHLTGSLPQVSLPKGATFITSHNELNGTIPASICPSCTIFDVAFNAISGSLPDAFSAYTALLAFNNISGPFPKAWTNQISELDASSNQITGTLPNPWQDFYLGLGDPLLLWMGLRQVNLSHNRLTGSCIGHWGDKQEAIIYRGDTGEADRVPMIYMDVLDLSDNALNGSVPTDLFEKGLSALSHLNLR